VQRKKTNLLNQSLSKVLIQINVPVWLLGYEFPETLLAVCASGKIILLSSAKKAAILESLKAKDTEDRLVILTRSKDAEVMKGIWESVVGMLGDNIGVFPKVCEDF
jgi:nucleosome binding factor SPN SPT16 subunit